MQDKRTVKIFVTGIINEGSSNQPTNQPTNPQDLKVEW